MIRQEGFLQCQTQPSKKNKNKKKTLFIHSDISYTSVDGKDSLYNLKFTGYRAWLAVVENNRLIESF